MFFFVQYINIHTALAHYYSQCLLLIATYIIEIEQTECIS